MHNRKETRLELHHWILLLLLSIKPLAANAWSNSSPTLPPDTSFLSVKAAKGDFQERLLRRYNLANYSCNLDKFRALNKLGSKDRLHLNKSYKLPVQIVPYDGKSIRTTLNIKDLEQAIRIQHFNDHALKSELRADDFRKSKGLWVPWHEFKCPPNGEEAMAEESDEDAPQIQTQAAGPKSGVGNRVFPIFGSKYAFTALIDQKLAGKVFFIVSGHGGIDSGAQGKRGGHTLCEDEYAYDVALRLTRLLVSHGATTYMIVRDPNDGIRDADFLDCDTDEVNWGDTPISAPQRERLQERCDVINHLTADFLKKGITDQTLVEIHVDSRSKSTKTDVFFYYRPGSVGSAAVANRMQETFELKYAKVRATRRYQGTVSERGLFMLTETTTPKAVYCELGNIRNPYDQLRLVMPRNRQLLAQWLLEAIKGE